MVAGFEATRDPVAVATEGRLSRADDVRPDWNCVFTGFGTTMVPVAAAAVERLSGPQRYRSPSGGHGVRLVCVDDGWPAWARRAVAAGEWLRERRVFAGGGATVVPLAVAADDRLSWADNGVRLDC